MLAAHALSNYRSRSLLMIARIQAGFQYEYGNRKDDFNRTQLNGIFAGLRYGSVVNEVDYGCLAANDRIEPRIRFTGNHGDHTPDANASG